MNPTDRDLPGEQSHNPNQNPKSTLWQTVSFLSLIFDIVQMIFWVFMSIYIGMISIALDQSSDGPTVENLWLSAVFLCYCLISLTGTTIGLRKKNASLLFLVLRSVVFGIYTAGYSFGILPVLLAEGDFAGLTSFLLHLFAFHGLGFLYLYAIWRAQKFLLKEG